MKEQAAPQDRLVRAAWAKSDRLTDDWYPLWAHLQDAAAVADLLFPQFLSESQRTLLAETFGSEERARKLAVWLGAVHDTGKATSAFAMQVDPLRTRMEEAGFEFPNDASPQERRSYPHGLAGQRAVMQYLSPWVEESRSNRTKIRALAEIVGGHHGVFPQQTVIPPAFDLWEPPQWSPVRVALLQRADQLAELDEDDWVQILAARITEPVQSLLSGFLIVCDWIASDTRFFPTSPLGAEPGYSPIARARRAVRALDFGGGWAPALVADYSDYYEDRFAIATPRPVQTDALRVVGNLREPSLVLVEAPTGEGKTEIGLSCAEAMAQQFGMNGLLVVLPTRATTNAMFGRVLTWLKHTIPEGESATATLAHGKAEFDEDFQELRRAGYRAQMFDEDGSPRGVHDPGNASVTANQWFQGRKKNVFSNFVVGTVDQLLFTALKSKHLTLRHLGFGSKVVVIDEVHAADTFMQTYLHRTLEWLGAYGVPVVALSATLPPMQRQALLASYRRGARTRMGLRPTDEQSTAQIMGAAKAPQYPLLTAIGAIQLAQVAPEQSGRVTTYRISEVDEDDRMGAVIRAVEHGGCIAVVLDTVDRAQRTFEELALRSGCEVELFHSRFTAESRGVREKELVRRLGKDASDRPKAMIVVATQVIEASLDVDFDMMFTDFAPTDLLLQRIGRVHRHARASSQRPANMGEAQIVLTGGSGILHGEEAPKFEKGVRSVYGDSLLLRSAAVLRALFAERGEQVVSIPQDVANLIRATYEEESDVPPAWQEVFEQAEEKRAAKDADQKKRSAAFSIAPPGTGHIASWSAAGYDEASEERGAAQVRDAELSVEVVLVQQRDGNVYPLPWLAPEFRDIAVDSMTGVDERVAREVAKCAVSLPPWLTRDSGLDRILDDLEKSGFEGWQRSYWLKGVLPLVLDEELRAVIGGERLRYDEEVGLVVEGKELV